MNLISFVNRKFVRLKKCKLLKFMQNSLITDKQAITPFEHNKTTEKLIFLFAFFFPLKLFSFLLLLKQDEVSNNTTRSELSFSPTVEDDGKFMVCRAENPVVSGLFLESTWKISVVCEYS